MKKILTIASLATLALTAGAAAQSAPLKGSKANQFPYSQPAKAQLRSERSFGSPMKSSEKMRVRSVATPEIFVLPGGDDCGYIDGPDGSTWYYTCVWDSETIEHEYFTETLIHGYTFTIYDDKFEQVGVIEDTVELEEGETKVAAVQLGAQVTRKFFNVDDNYELMVCVATNTTTYNNNYRTRVYSLGKSGVVTTIPGYYVSAINTATDDWSEKYWITFATEQDPEQSMIEGVPNVMDNVFTTWKSAGYGGLGDPVLTVRVPVVLLAGENAIPFLSRVHNGKPWFASVMLKKSYYENPFDYNNENLTPDNELRVSLYTTGTGWNAGVEPYSTTVIPTSSNIEDHQFVYVGNFSYDDDISFDTYTTDGNPSLIVTTESWIPATDSYLYRYDVRTAAPAGAEAQASPILTLCQNTEGGYFMNDLRGFDPQVMFIKNNGSNYYFEFVNLINGEVEHVLDQYVTDDIMVTASTQRVAGGDSYLYVTSQTTGNFDDEGNCLHGMVYVTPDGEIDHIDQINLGKGVGYAMVYMGVDALNPYVFNLDDTMEYMALVKRYDNLETLTGTLHEELVVAPAGEKDSPIFCVGPDEEKGNLAHIWLSNLEGEKPVLAVKFNKNYHYTTQTWALPLSTFAEGDGTLDNPYRLSTAGELGYIGNEPGAHYVLATDIDGGGYVIRNKDFLFTGSLDGQHHTVSNLNIDGRALLPRVAGPLDGQEGNVGVICNLNMTDIHFVPTSDLQGTVAGMVMGGRVSDVHLYDCDVTAAGDVTVGGIVGQATLGTTVEGCSMSGGNVSVPDGSVGGIVGSTRTGASVRACAFTGTIAAGTEVGGIVGAMEHSDDRLSDCHVNADITARNNLGGIVGNSARGLISHCHVQGTLTATEAPRWGGGPCMGGVAGRLDPFYSDDPNAADPVAIQGCYVALSAMNSYEDTATETYEGQNDTMHRIVGWTNANAEADPIGYDEEWNPIYGDANPPEGGLQDNYAIDTLADHGKSGAQGTDGADVSASQLGTDFFTNLGFAYGSDADSPWSQTGDTTSPRLWYEGGLLLFTPSTMTVDTGKGATVTLALKGERLTEQMLESFTCDIADESIIEISDISIEDGSIAITINGLAEGETTLTASVGTNTAVCHVKVNKYSGVAAAVATNGIAYDGRTLRADGSAIEVYDLRGVRVLAGRDALDVSSLPGGIYVATATSADGRSTLKLRR